MNDRAAGPRRFHEDSTQPLLLHRAGLGVPRRVHAAAVVRGVAAEAVGVNSCRAGN